jgi:thioredoxin 1
MVKQIQSESELNSLLNASESRGKVVIVDFFAPWCGPCRRFAPRFDELANLNPNAVFCKVDVDELPELSAQYGVSAMPTFILFLNGQKHGQSIVGASEMQIDALYHQITGVHLISQ